MSTIENRLQVENGLLKSKLEAANSEIVELKHQLECYRKADQTQMDDSLIWFVNENATNRKAYEMKCQKLLSMQSKARFRMRIQLIQLGAIVLYSVFAFGPQQNLLLVIGAAWFAWYGGYHCREMRRLGHEVRSM